MEVKKNGMENSGSEEGWGIGNHGSIQTALLGLSFVLYFSAVTQVPTEQEL